MKLELERKDLSDEYRTIDMRDAKREHFPASVQAVIDLAGYATVQALNGRWYRVYGVKK